MDSKSEYFAKTYLSISAIWFFHSIGYCAAWILLMISSIAGTFMWSISSLSSVEKP